MHWLLPLTALLFASPALAAKPQAAHPAAPAKPAPAQPQANAQDFEDLQEYRHCLTLAAQKPDDGWEEAIAWQSLGGGEPAQHCAALALITLKKYEGAARRLETLAEESKRDAPFRANYLVQAAQAWVLAGNPGRAYAAQSSALQLSPNDPEILIDRATTVASSGRPQEALADLDRALTLSPNRVEAIVLKGSALRQTGDLAGAEALIARAIELDPKYPDAWIERGALMAQKGQLDQARKDFLKAVELAPKAASADVARDNLQQLDAK